MPTPERGPDGFFHPANEGELAQLIGSASDSNQQFRVRGAMHSVLPAITTDGWNGPTDPGPGYDVKLDRMNCISQRNPSPGGLITVQAGCHIGADPLDPAATWDASLLAWMDRNSWGTLDDLGGITHQTVGGFLSTGSSGGCLQRSIEPQIRRIRVMDATGTPRDFLPGSDEFLAAGVSLGLLGVVTEIDLYPVDKFCITGQEATTTLADAELDLLGDGTPGRPSLATFLAETEYTRIMWWPQPKVGKLVVWKATASACPAPDKIVPYQELGGPGLPLLDLVDLLPVLLRTVRALVVNRVALEGLLARNRALFDDDLATALVQLLDDLEEGDPYDGIKLIEGLAEQFGLEVFVDLYFTLLGNRTSDPLAIAMFDAIFENEQDFEGTWSPRIMNQLFLVADKDKAPPNKGKANAFVDYSYRSLPMDNEIADRLMPTEFTELWIPIARTKDVMNKLAAFYDQGGYAATGTYACEIYGAKQSDFWLSPAYGTDVVRIDIFWFGGNAGSPATSFFPAFWKVLEPFGFRPHWGKYLPPADGPTGARYLAAKYPRLDDFMTLRAKQDPKGMFVTEYWRDHLGITVPVRT